jgi:adenine-specific DNA-methyltransferase
MAYLKQWAPRALKDIELRVPALLPRAHHGKGRAMQREAVEAAGEAVDLAYLDPPYNQHSYLGNYHVWETLVRGDQPETYGVAQKRDDCRVRRSAFNTRKGCEVALREVLSQLQARAVVVSFSDEGYISREALEEALGGLWGGAARVTTMAHDYKRYVGAQIGIYNPQGEKVGRVGRLRNQEYLFVATRAE